MRMIQTKPNCCSVQYFVPISHHVEVCPAYLFYLKNRFSNGHILSEHLLKMTNVNFSPFYTALCLFICLLKELGAEQAKSHWVHLFDFSPL